MINHFFKYCFLIFVPLFTPNLYATEIKNTGDLYRVDTRRPDQIFKYGFQSFGENDDLREHSRGRSCVGREQNSAFISTSADPVYAANYARRLYQNTQHPVYIYIINSADNIYNMRASLRLQQYEAGIPDAVRQSEWIAYQNIPTENIRGVRIYTGQTTAPAITPNPYFIERRAQINNQPYVVSRATHVPPPPQALYASIRPLITACMSAMVSCFGYSRLKTETQCTVSNINMYKKVSSSFLLQVVANTNLFNSVT